MKLIVEMKLNPGLQWQKQHSSSRRLSTPANGTFKQETSVMYSVVLCWNLSTSESRSEIPGKFWNAVLVKDGGQLDGSYKKWRTITYGRGKEFPKNNKKKNTAWIRHTLRNHSLLKHIMEGKLEGRIKVAGRQGRSRTQLPDDLRKRKDTVTWKRN